MAVKKALLSTTANSRQIGGDHYKSKYEHWDFVEDVGMGYLEGNATKYISRWRKKAGVQDLDKGLHYVDKLRELNKRSGKQRRRNRITGGQRLVDTCAERFCTANELQPTERLIITLLTTWKDDADLLSARTLLIGLTEGFRALSHMPSGKARDSI